MTGRWLLAAALAAALVPEAALAAPAWTPPTALGTGASAPAIGAAGDGTVTVAWQAGDAVLTSSRPPAGAFGAPAQLSGAGAEAGSPAVAVNAAGATVVAWVSDDGATTSIETASGAGGALAPAGAVPSPGDDPSELQTGIDGAGRQWFAWLHEAPAGARVRVARRDPGGPIVSVGDVSAAGASELSLAVGRAGAAVVTWVRTTEAMGGDVVQTRIELADLAGGVPAATLAQAEQVTTVAGGVDVTLGDLLQTPKAAIAPDTAVVGWLREVIADPNGTPSEPDDDSIVQEVRSNLAAGPIAQTAATILTLDLAAGQEGVAVAAWEERLTASATSVRSAVRPPGGAFGSPQTLATGGPGASVSDPRAAVRAGGEPVVSWRQDERLAASAGGAAPLELTPSGATGPALLAADDDGNVAAAWEHDPSPADDDEQIRVAAYDAVGPRLTGFTAPVRTEIGVSNRFAVTAVDVWSGVAGLGWAFGDGGSASGADVTHTYTSAGQFPVTVTGSDGLGNARSTGATVAVGQPPAPPPPPPPPPPPAAPADTAAPLITGLRPVARCVRSGSALEFALTLSESASVRFILRRRQGSPGRRRCPAVRGRRPGGASPVDDQTRQLPAGENTVGVTARVRRAGRLAAGRSRVRLAQRRLRPGTYQLIARPTDAAGNRGADAIAKVWVLRR